MKIYHKEKAIHVKKPEGTDVTYFLFNEYEVHYNEQAPHTTQTWHHHEHIWESLYIIEGELLAKWRENEIERSEVVKSGDLVETEKTTHTFFNNSDSVVKFLVIKQVPQGKDFRDIMKEDKVIDD